MDENRTIGAAKNLGGKVEEGFGRATGDAKTTVQGQMRQAEGSLQDLYGQAVDSAGDTVDAVRQMPSSLDDTIRRY
ncbi:MAG TPA: CsbD family protein, partial [Xanthobacteraceae bacterium]